MSNKIKAIIAIIALAVAFAAGRFAPPVKVKTETKIVEVEKKTNSTETDRDKHKETTTHTVKNTDGSEETTTHTVEDTQTDRSSRSTDDTSKSRSDTAETTYAGAKVHVTGMGGISSFATPVPVYGLGISKDVLGPISVGAFGFTNHIFGISVGLSF